MNIPQTNLDAAKNILLVGVGSGFDVFTGLPFVYHWPDKNFVLTNSSPSGDFHYRTVEPKDYPEFHIEAEPNILARYSIGRHGVQAVKRAFHEIIAKYDIDAVLAVDGGVDSLARGDEENPGTVLEDFISLAALKDLREKTVLCCAGFGGETEEEVNHYRVLENIAALAANGSFLGSFSLTKDMPEYKKYKEQCDKTWADGRRKSHIQTKIISAIEGQFGDANLYDNIDAKIFAASTTVFISPLTSIYWMFSLDGVLKHNKFVEKLSKGNTFADSKILYRSIKENLPARRSKEVIPL